MNLDPDWIRDISEPAPKHEPLYMNNPLEEAQQILNAIRNLVEQRQVVWNEMPREGSPSELHAFNGVGPGFTVIAAQANVEGRGVVYDGAATMMSKLMIVHLPEDLAKFCYDAAAAAQN